MDLLKGNLKKIYFKYLFASFGSALIVSVYSLVDCVMVGQYEGPDGVAALATVAPVWNIIYSLGLLFGIGGSVLMSAAKGAGDESRGNSFYTMAFIGAAVVAVLSWLGIIFFQDALLRLFGADDLLLGLAGKYLFWIKFVAPLFVFGQFFAAFIRNDNAPATATVAVMAGGVFNIIGDYIFVFVCDMGISGAGLATALGQVLSICILCSHILSKKCRLRFERPVGFGHMTRQIVLTGFSTFFIDIAMGILSMMFNNQIMKYSGSPALAVYGVIINVNTLVQACAYGVGQAAQPIISMNYGAGKGERIRKTLRLSLITVVVLSIVWTTLTMALPEPLIRLFMSPTPEVLAIAPDIMRKYFISFLLLTYNIYSTYYFQAIMRPKASLAVSVLRGMVVSGLLIYTLPALLGAEALWFAMPITEMVTAVIVAVLMRRYNKRLKMLS
ncbi:Multidrug export protein MepA [Eubacterium callanderi]|uniref:MATE family efflux transporter n=1 Tax=Eubacterium callanderi TaxID=53442 RepID=UPI0029FF48E8|nr:MATE family efflux transporter [Eubacterium callanderi]WPK69801.1 Multidrug export protein MepA [Eubacterium callanderi]WPK74099.1 Multidrug export protein MepA [Eubacterium callanderi]